VSVIASTGIVDAGDAKRREWAGSWSLGFVAAASSGVLLGLSFTPFGIYWIPWLALIPWLAILPRLTPWRAWLLGACLGLVFYRIALAWLFGVLGPAATVVLVIFAIVMGLAFRMARMLADMLGPWALWWSLPLLFTGQEVLRSESLARIRLGYGALGYSQAGNLWIAQVASIGGVYFLTFLIVAVNAAIAYALVRRRLWAWLPTLALGATIITLAWLARPVGEATGESLAVACVQSESEDDRDYVRLTRQAANADEWPRIIVLPEHTIVGAAEQPHPFVDRLARIAIEQEAYVCVGAHVSAADGAACDYDNVAMLIGPNGARVGWQSKAVPVPFISDGNPARDQRLFDTDLGRVGMCVCYDADFTDVPRRVVDLGADYLLIPVMNPQRWPVQQLAEQAAMSQIRSIELRRWTVRAASSGVSQIVSPGGRVIATRSREAGPGVLHGQIWRNTERTVFIEGGHWFATAAGLAYLVAVVVLTFWSFVARSKRRTS